MSCISGRRGVFGFNLATWLCPVREKVRPARLDVGVSAKMFAHRAENTPKLVFLCLLGEFCRGQAQGSPVLGKFCRACRHRGLALWSVRCPPRRWWWGFCSIRGCLSACRRRVVVLMTPFPPFGGGEVAVRGGVVPTVQTTSAKNGENGWLRVRWSAFWAQWCQSWWPCWQPGPSAGSMNPSMRS